MFEEIVMRQMKELGLRGVIVRGITERQKIEEHAGIRFYNYCTSDDLEEMIYQSELVVSRSGYTTIMDLCVSGKKAVFCPTPGQTEQEYLARELDKKGLVPHFEQNKFDLREAMIKSMDYAGLPRFDMEQRDWTGLFTLFSG